MGTPTLAPLSGQDRAAFVALMDGVFECDPWYAALFGSGAQPRRAEFLSFLFDLSNWTGAELVGLWQGDRLLGAYILDGPDIRVWAWPRVVVRALTGPIGLSWQNADLIRRYLSHTRSAVPRGRTHYLTLIGVSAAVRGQGLGRRLLEVLLTRVDRDGATLGIGLDTENAANVGFYERFGFSVTRTTVLEGIVIHSLFRPRGPGHACAR